MQTSIPFSGLHKLELFYLATTRQGLSPKQKNIIDGVGTEFGWGHQQLNGHDIFIGLVPNDDPKVTTNPHTIYIATGDKAPEALETAVRQKLAPILHQAGVLEKEKPLIPGRIPEYKWTEYEGSIAKLPNKLGYALKEKDGITFFNPLGTAIGDICNGWLFLWKSSLNDKFKIFINTKLSAASFKDRSSTYRTKKLKTNVESFWQSLTKLKA